MLQGHVAATEHLCSVHWCDVYQGRVTENVPATCPLVRTGAFIIVQHQFRGYFVPKTWRTEFNLLNFIRQVARTKYPPNWRGTIIKLSVHTKGHVAATYPWDMNPSYFQVRVYILWFCPCYMSPQCALYKFFFFFSLKHVLATRPLVSVHPKNHVHKMRVTCTRVARGLSTPTILGRRTKATPHRLISDDGYGNTT